MSREPSAWAKGEEDREYNYFPDHDQPVSKADKEWHAAQDEWDSHLPECPQREYGKVCRCICGDPDQI